MLMRFETSMKRFNPHRTYRLGRTLTVLDDVAIGDKLDDYKLTFYFAGLALEQVISSQIVKVSEGTRIAARELKHHLDTAFTDTRSGRSLEVVTHGLKSDISSAFRTFETRFDGDCHWLNLFDIPDVLAYDNTSLIENGIALFPETLHPIMSEMLKNDIREAARCLALDSPTACGFHLGRAIEETMRQYHLKFIGALPARAKRTMGGLYNNWTSQPSIPSSLLANVLNIKDHYRNPVSHPEVFLTSEDAHGMIGLYVSAMTEMLTAIKNNP